MSVGFFIAAGIVLMAGGAFAWLAARAGAEANRLKASVLAARTETVLQAVPEPLAALAERFGPVPEGAVALSVSQTGEMRLSPEGAWLPFRADTVFALDTVAFVWDAWVRLMPGVKVRVLDAYDGTHGVLCVRLFGVLPLVAARGADVDRAEVQRYIAELAWNSAAFGRNGALSISALGEGAFAVRHRDDPLSRVDLRLGPDGTISDIRADARPMRVGNAVVEQPWAGVFAGWGRVGPVSMPRRGRVSWLLPRGAYEYWRGDIRRAEFLDAAGNAILP